MKHTVILLPTDNRPITYLFPQFICQLANLDFLVPPRELMGSLVAPTDIGALYDWLEKSVKKVRNGAILICVDSLLYGGLIPSRRGTESEKTILERAADIVNLKKLSGDKLKIYAQSSIMRISNNYDNTEEKLYWSEYGQEIFHWSELLHQKEINLLSSNTELQAAESLIKPEIRQDYLATRNRNFSVNKKIIDYALSGNLDFLIFSQDDSGQYGLNVLEKDKIRQIAKEKNATNILAYAGADEMLMTLIARYLNDLCVQAPQVSIHYSSPDGKTIGSNYEGQNIGSSVDCQAHAQGLQTVEADITSNAVDFVIIVHTGKEMQGDHMWLPGLKDMRFVETAASAKQTIEIMEKAKVPVVLCDVAYSNGSDPVLIAQLLKRPELLKRLWAYGGWNTTGNAIGSALAVGSACLYAQSTAANSAQGLPDEKRKELLFLRLMDDWAYQTQVRKEIQPDKLGNETREEVLDRLMCKYAIEVAEALDYEPGPLKFSLPWQRTFEVEINLNPQFVTSMS